jgi:hypothetical protein
MARGKVDYPLRQTHLHMADQFERELQKIIPSFCLVTADQTTLTMPPTRRLYHPCNAYRPSEER